MLAVREAHREKLASELASTEAGNVPQRALPFEEPGSSWSEHNITWPSSSSTDSVETGISTEKLKDVGQRSVLAPEGFNLHPTLLRHIKQRLASLESGTGVNWATAEVSLEMEEIPSISADIDIYSPHAGIGMGQSDG